MIGYNRPHKNGPSITFDRVLEIAKSQPVGEINDWSDISRLDVRPGKGVITKNQWEIQIDSQSGAVPSTAYRRSDIIEAIHEGTFFHDAARLGIFLPAANNLITAAKIGVRNNVSMDKSQRVGVSIRLGPEQRFYGSGLAFRQ